MFHAVVLALFLLSSLVSPTLAWFRLACTTPLVSERYLLPLALILCVG
jgi:hypothetical protein